MDSIGSIFEESGFNIIESETNIDKEDIFKPPMLSEVKRGSWEAAIKLGLIPEEYKGCIFDEDLVRRNISNQLKKLGKPFKVKNFKKYCDTLDSIVSTILAHKLPNRSYLIGAPNGFGKTSFVNYCIAALFQQDRLCTPYISLSELAEIRADSNVRLLHGVKSDDYYNPRHKAKTREEYIELLYEELCEQGFEKLPIKITDKFSWSEYINSDILFCYFTDINSKIIESETLKTVLTLRGTKCKPTIALMSTSLKPYLSDSLNEYVWSEILEYDVAGSYDRVEHISTYKVRSGYLNNDDSDEVE